MKYTITEVDTDAKQQVAVKVTFEDGSVKTNTVLHFDPEVATKENIISAIKTAAPEVTPEVEIEKERENERLSKASVIISSLASSVGKSTTI